jgi:hypothetical protein
MSLDGYWANRRPRDRRESLPPPCRSALYAGDVLRHDFIKRLIEKMAAFMARLAGFAADGKLDEADGELQAIERELGLPRGYEVLDSRSLALLLGNADKVALASLLFWHRSEIAADRGHVADAARLEVRAKQLYQTIARDELSPAALELLARHPLSQGN